VSRGKAPRAAARAAGRPWGHVGWRRLIGARKTQHHRLQGDERPIPLLATNLDFDTEGYLARLVEGWDYPARHKLVVAGGCEQHLV
jgi:hypothetical protein